MNYCAPVCSESIYCFFSGTPQATSSEEDQQIVIQSQAQEESLSPEAEEKASIEEPASIAATAVEQNVPRLEIPPRSNDRPKLSYSALIAMAIQNSPGQKATLNAIYDWIQDAFPYFARIDKAGWQNSIRHNLSLHKAFYRTKTDTPARKGGGEWRIDGKHSIGAFRKVQRSQHRPKTVKLDESFWEPDQDSYLALDSSQAQINSTENSLILIATPEEVVAIQEKPREMQRDERRQSIEEFIEMSLGNPGGSQSPIKNVDYEVPLPPEITSNDDLHPPSQKAKKARLEVGKNVLKKDKFHGTLDFYEAYDPVQVSKVGHSVIIESDSQKVDALCFLCGSKGEEEMLLCKSCCEPYHPFCLNPEELPQTSEAEINWVCRKCIQCQICGRNEGDSLRCAECTLAFHLPCLAPSQQKMVEFQEDTSWLCGSCLRCDSCSVANVAHFDEDGKPLCDQCCLQKKKGSYCPLCQGCYDDNDYETRMMECATCSGWIHAKCEGIDAEKYQVLSYLPNTVDYMCK